MKKLFPVLAVLALLVMGAASATADPWLQNFSTTVSDPAGYDQIQLTWLSGDTFNGIGFWSGNAGWTIYQTSTLFIATSQTGPVTGVNQKNLAINFDGLADATSFRWQQFNGPTRCVDPWGNVVVSNPTESYLNWTYQYDGGPGVRLDNPAVPEPSGLAALASGLLGLGVFVRRRR